MYKFNKNANYKSGAAYTKKLLFVSHQKIYVNKDFSFTVKFPDVFQCYVNPTLTGDVRGANAAYVAWMTEPLRWWQNQLHFAVWCATAGSGVTEEHLQASDPFIQAMYRFHLYYQIRRILDEMQIPMPTDPAFHMYNNPYNKATYQRLCNEFNVNPNVDWRQHVDKGGSNGLGSYVQYETPSGRERMSMRKRGKGPVFFSPRDEIKHTVDISGAWTTFIPDKSSGFTQAGVVRLNDSIRTYVWALLGAQGQTRTSITERGTGFDAQKQFLANIEDSINAPVNLETAIKKYQDVLQYARSEVNFVFGIGLYMAPSDMALKVGTGINYNNKIIIATSDQNIGVNKGLNERIIQAPTVHIPVVPTPVIPNKAQPYNLVAPSGKALQWSKGHWALVPLSDADEITLDSEKTLIDYKSGKPLGTPLTKAGETRVSVGLSSGWSTLTYKDGKIMQTSRPWISIGGDTIPKLSASKNQFNLKSAPPVLKNQPESTHEDYKSALTVGSLGVGLLLIWYAT